MTVLHYNSVGFVQDRGQVCEVLLRIEQRQRQQQEMWKGIILLEVKAPHYNTKGEKAANTVPLNIVRVVKESSAVILTCTLRVII